MVVRVWHGNARCIFVMIQGLLERTVVEVNQPLSLFEIARAYPVLRVMGCQRPAHDGQALIQDGAIGQLQHRYRRFFRRFGQRGGLAPQHDLTQLYGNA